MRIFMIIVYFLLAVIGVTFAALNASSVEVNFYFTQLTMPVSVLMIAMLGIGLVLGFLSFLFRSRRR